MFERLHYVGNGFGIMQKMDLTTDTAIYEDRQGNLLMTVDSSCDAKDGKGNDIGRFTMKHPSGTWSYEGNDGTVIDTPDTLLFDRAEPRVIKMLFAHLAR